MDVDEALGGLVVESVVGIVGGQAEIIQRVGALASHHGAGTLEELQLHRAGHALLGVGEEGVEGLLQRREPQAVVHLLGPGLLDGEFVVQHAPLQAQILQGLVSLDEGQTARHLVALAALHAHEPVLHHIDAAVAVGAGDIVHGVDDVEEAHRSAVKRTGNALIELDFHVGGLVGRAGRIARHRPNIRRRLAPGILQHAALDGPAPQVVVDGIGLVGRGLHRHAMGRRPLDFVGPAAEIPVAHRGDNGERRIQHEHRGLEAHLVVALARAAMGHVLGAELMGHRHEVLGDERPRERAHERVLVLVHGVGGHGAGEVLVGEGLPHVDDRAADGTGGERLGLDGLEALVLLAEITHDGDDVEIVFLLQPFDAHGGVEAAGVGEHAPFLLAGGRLGGDLRGVVKG